MDAERIQQVAFDDPHVSGLVVRLIPLFPPNGKPVERFIDLPATGSFEERCLRDGLSVKVFFDRRSH